MQSGILFSLMHVIIYYFVIFRKVWFENRYLNCIWCVGLASFNLEIICGGHDPSFDLCYDGISGSSLHISLICSLPPYLPLSLIFLNSEICWVRGSESFTYRYDGVSVCQLIYLFFFCTRKPDPSLVYFSTSCKQFRPMDSSAIYFYLWLI